MDITGREANLILTGLDVLCATDASGMVTKTRCGYSLTEVQALRDRLFAAHEHPEEQD